MGQWGKLSEMEAREGSWLTFLLKKLSALELQKSTASLCVEHNPSEAGRHVLGCVLDCGCVVSQASNPGEVQRVVGLPVKASEM